MQKAYLPGKIFTGTNWLYNHAVTVKDGIVQQVVPAQELVGGFVVETWPDAFLAPAFIDVQIYGADKKLFATYPTTDALEALYNSCLKGGTTLFQPTVATNSKKVVYTCIDAVRAYWQHGGKGVHGLHLEGPWINKDKKGAHIEAFIHAPDVAEVSELLQYGKGVITMITLAPEICRQEVITLLQAHNIIVSAGHSNANYAQATEAFNNGIQTVTHLYNAMSPLQHREPGFAGAVLNHAFVKSSIIPDGYHVNFAAVSIAKKIMGSRLFAITDAVTETTSGPYQHQLQGDKYVCNHILSGSALTMHKAFYNLVNFVGIEVDEALRMCSLYPAQVLNNSHQYGKIAPGYAAQFVVLNNQLSLLQVING